MLKRTFHIIVSAWLAILLLFGNTSKEFIHLFANHTDTEHTHHDDGFHIEPKHHHCSFLSFTLPPFLNDAHTVPSVFHTEHYPVPCAIALVQLTSRAVFASFLRGPPAFI